MVQGRAVNRLELHKTLWDQASRTGRIEIYQKGLAAEMGISQVTMCACIDFLTTEGRIRKVASRKNNVGVYQIYDPSLFEHPFIKGQSTPVEGLHRCATCGEYEATGLHPAVAGRPR